MGLIVGLQTEWKKLKTAVSSAFQVELYSNSMQECFVKWGREFENCFWRMLV